MLTSTWYYWGPDTLGLETECVCMGKGIILTLRKEIQMMQKHWRKKWGKIYIYSKSAISAEKALKFEGYQQKHLYLGHLPLTGGTGKNMQDVSLITLMTMSGFHKEYRGQLLTIIMV